MKKQVVALLLIAVIVGAIAVYVAVSFRSEPAVTGGVFPVDSAGKVLVASEGKVTLEIPPNALIEKTNITINPTQDSTLANYTLVAAYQFGPEGTYFLTPATVKVTYDPQILPSGLNQNDLRLFTVVTAGFGQVANSSVDTTNHIVFGQISHFSKVYVAASESKPEPKNFPIVGKWDRTDGIDKYTFRNGGSTQTIINGNPYFGRWQQDNSNPNKYTLTWSHSPPNPTKGTFVDYITIASDGKTYEGVNNYDSSIHCVRVDDDKPPVAAIKLPPPPNKVEQKITLYSTSYDPDDPAAMLKYTWTVISPKGQVVATSASAEEQTTFIPHNIGDYVVTLKVDDGVQSDLAEVILTLEPNVSITPNKFRIGGWLTPNSVEIMFEIKNYGIERIYIMPYVWFTGTWGSNELGPTNISKYSQEIPGAGTPGHNYAYGTVKFKYETPGISGGSWNITGMKWNAIIEVYIDPPSGPIQTTLYTDPPWVKEMVVPDENYSNYPAHLGGPIPIDGPKSGPIIEGPDH